MSGYERLDGQRTIYIAWVVQVNSQNPAGREGQHENIVGDLGGHKVGGNGELQLHPFDFEDRQ